MKKTIIIPIIAGIVASWCVQKQTKNSGKNIADTLGQKKEQSKNSPIHISFATSLLNLDQQQQIGKTVTSYMDFYHIAMSDLIISENTSSSDTTLAYADPWIIYLVPKNIANAETVKLINTITHELFHSIKSKEMTLLPKYKLIDGFTIIGTHGLSVIVQKGKTQTKFWRIEEAAAEALASKYSPTYRSTNNVYYANVGSLMLKIIGRWRLTSDDLIHAQQTNDLTGMIGKMFNKHASSNDIETAMILFNDVYNTTDDLTDQAISKIEKIRNK